MFPTRPCQLREMTLATVQLIPLAALAHRKWRQFSFWKPKNGSVSFAWFRRLAAATRFRTDSNCHGDQDSAGWFHNEALQRLTLAFSGRPTT